MFRKTIIILFCMGCFIALEAQTLDNLKEKYTMNKRDIKLVTAYVEALEKANEKKEAEAVVREYMSRCPVLQVEDKDTYLLLNRYVFADPYSNVFEYGIYAVRKMKWDRGDEEQGEDKAARLKRMFKGMGSGVSGADEIDKRYEVLMVLSKNLNKEIDKQCKPSYQDDRYIMPDYDSVKMKRLTYLVNKGELLGQDGMRMKLAVAKAFRAKDYEGIMRNLEVASELRLTGIDGGYVVAVVSVLAGRSMEKVTLEKALAFVLRLSEQEKADGGSTNYYNLLGQLYSLAGDKTNADKYTKMGNAIEAERMARFGDLFKALQSN